MKPPPRVLAVASGGGHWTQLYRMRTAWDGCKVTYVTTDPGFNQMVQADASERGQAAPGYRVVREANRWQKLRLVQSALQMAATVARHRPNVVITTGAAPGYIAIRLSKLVRARTVWIDSIANGEELSLSGQKAARHATLTLTQWEDLAGIHGAQFKGAVL